MAFLLLMSFIMEFWPVFKEFVTFFKQLWMTKGHDLVLWMTVNDKKSHNIVNDSFAQSQTVYLFRMYITNLAVCWRRALRNVSGWNSSDRSSVSCNSRPLSAFSTHVCIACALVTRPRRYCIGSSGPSHLPCQLSGVCNTKQCTTWNTAQPSILLKM